MSKLSPKHQFRLERKYRRRAALKYARPQFIKGVQLAQWAIIGCGSLRASKIDYFRTLLLTMVCSCCDLCGAFHELGY
jgi:hypothetical protein